MNTKQQGLIGVGQAIAYYTAQNVVVSLPINDSQDYDLVVDDGTGLKKVQVKTSRYKRNGKYVVELKSSGGNSGRILKRFEPDAVDILFIHTMDGTNYEIPTAEVSCKVAITLYEKYQKWVVR